MPPKAKKPPRHMITDDEIAIADIPDKGASLVTTVDLPPNSRLWYYGQEIGKIRLARIYAKSEEEGTEDWAEYIVPSGRKDVWIDGHPRRKEAKQSFANLVNEPSKGETANTILAFQTNEQGVKWPVLVTVKALPAGSQLLFHYGSDFNRSYKVGKKPVIPKWLK
jgi:hypothetical protein